MTKIISHCTFLMKHHGYKPSAPKFQTKSDCMKNTH